MPFDITYLCINALWELKTLKGQCGLWMRLNITDEDLKEGVEEVQEATKIGISKDYERIYSDSFDFKKENPRYFNIIL